MTEQSTVSSAYFRMQKHFVENKLEYHRFKCKIVLLLIIEQLKAMPPKLQTNVNYLLRKINKTWNVSTNMELKISGKHPIRIWWNPYRKEKMVLDEEIQAALPEKSRPFSTYTKSAADNFENS